MVGNHNLYTEEGLIIDWNKQGMDFNPERGIGFNPGDIVALCYEEIFGFNVFWVESATHEEAEELMSFYTK